jgi:hypothetical protein
VNAIEFSEGRLNRLGVYNPHELTNVLQLPTESTTLSDFPRLKDRLLQAHILDWNLLELAGC